MRRNDTEVAPGNFRVKGDTIDITPAYSEDLVRISLFGDEVEKIALLDHVSLKEKKKLSQIKIFLQNIILSQMMLEKMQYNQSKMNYKNDYLH